jgi:hypothetical protein
VHAALWLPPAPFRGILQRRAIVLWVLGRLILLGSSRLPWPRPNLEGRAPPGPITVTDLRVPLVTALALIALVAGLTAFDAIRRRETLLLANLGTNRLGLLATGAIPCALLEAGVWLLVR